MAAFRKFCRENPQAVLLGVIALVLGIGTFIVVLIAVAQSGSTNNNGEPSDLILLGHALLGLG